MKRRFFISPRAAKYCKATFNADSTASDPSPLYSTSVKQLPETRFTSSVSDSRALLVNRYRYA